jgi:hypothetical protein
MPLGTSLILSTWRWEGGLSVMYADLCVFEFISYVVLFIVIGFLCLPDESSQVCFCVQDDPPVG